MLRHARVAELADALDLGSSGITVGVRLPSLAPRSKNHEKSAPHRRRCLYIETFEKCSISFKVKEDENSNPPDFYRDSQEYF